MGKGVTIGDIARKINDYIDENAGGLPILKECCLQNGWDHDGLLRKAERSPSLRLAINRLMCQREVNLEKGGIFGNFNKQMAVLLLKELAQDQARSKNAEAEALEKLDALLGLDSGDIDCDGDDDFDGDGE